MVIFAPFHLMVIIMQIRFLVTMLVKEKMALNMRKQFVSFVVSIFFAMLRTYLPPTTTTSKPSRPLVTRRKVLFSGLQNMSVFT